MRWRSTVAAVIFSLSTGLAATAPAYEAASGEPPQARSEAITEQRFGLTYTDPYRWMENADDGALYPWLRAEESYTDVQTAGALRDQLAAEFRNIMTDKDQVKLIAESRKFEELKNRGQYLKFRKVEYDGDRMTLSAPSSERYQFVLTPDNTDIQNLQIKDTRTGEFLQDVLRVKFAGLVWDPDQKSFVYCSSRDGRLGGAGDVIRRHVPGTAQTADATLHESTNPEEHFSLFEYNGKTYLSRSGPAGNRLSLFDLASGKEDVLFETKGGLLNSFAIQQDKFWFISYLEEDMGEVVVFDTLTRKFTTRVGARNVPIDLAVLISDDLYLAYIRNGAHELRRFNLTSLKMSPVPLPVRGTVSFQDTDDNASGEALFDLHTYIAGPDQYAYNPKTGTLRLVKKGIRPDIELHADRVFYTPVEGWTAPMWVVKRKDVEYSPEMPVFLYGYGGFQVSQLPSYDPTYLPWLRHGGAVAFVVLPGGMEYGEAWHRLGMRENKRNVFDAFARAAKTLIAKGWTNERKIAIGGASNGGLLAAATARYYPSLFRVTVPRVGVLDMTRFSLFTGGADWIAEYGDRDKAEDFRNLLSISPYHHLRKDARYPSTLIVTCDQDDRVVPAHSYKFAARLQTTLPGVRSLLLVVHGTGHNYYKAAAEEKVRTASIIWTFIMQEVGVH